MFPPAANVSTNSTGSFLLVALSWSLLNEIYRSDRLTLKCRWIRVVSSFQRCVPCLRNLSRRFTIQPWTLAVIITVYIGSWGFGSVTSHLPTLLGSCIFCAVVRMQYKFAETHKLEDFQTFGHVTVNVTSGLIVQHCYPQHFAGTKLLLIENI